VRVSSDTSLIHSWHHTLKKGAVVLAVGCVLASPVVAQVSAPTPLCRGLGISVDVRFARAGGYRCQVHRVLGRAEVHLEVKPETTPINPSPWYAIRLTSQSARLASVRLNYGPYRHRYHPHVKSNLQAWSQVPVEYVTTTADGHQTTVQVALERGTNWFAGQPFDQPALMTRALDQKVTSGELIKTNYGQSRADIALVGYQTTRDQREGSLVLLTRQHPPEVAGEWAFDAFVDEVLGSSNIALAFRARFGVVILPVVNPDGIAAGHWRTNLGLVDLNRDWGPFAQPESRAAADFITQATHQSPPIAMIDFHATNRDVIYAQPKGDALFPTGLVNNWLENWTRALKENAPTIDRSHNASNANSKSWGRVTFGIAAITYEVGDATPRQQAEERARLAAKIFMEQALVMPVSDLTRNPIPVGSIP
jgi:cytosolic carboxypeptidase protein 6